jgi:hypothetical protein
MSHRNLYTAGRPLMRHSKFLRGFEVYVLMVFLISVFPCWCSCCRLLHDYVRARSFFVRSIRCLVSMMLMENWIVKVSAARSSNLPIMRRLIHQSDVHDELLGASVYNRFLSVGK